MYLKISIKNNGHPLSAIDTNDRNFQINIQKYTTPLLRHFDIHIYKHMLKFIES